MPKLVRIFVSHAARDRTFVERLIPVFEQHRLRYWYSRKHLRGAQQWHDEIGKALRACNWFLLVLSPASVTSPWVKRELLYALEQPAYRQRIVVLDYRKANDKRLSWTLRSVQWVDFRHAFDDGCDQLLRVWGKRRASR